MMRRVGKWVRIAPSALEVEAEAIEFYQQSQSLRVELSSLRSDITACALEIRSFTEVMRDVAREQRRP